MDRRTFIASAGTAALIAGLRPVAAAQAATAGGADARLNALFDRIFGCLDPAARTRLLDLLREIDRTIADSNAPGDSLGNIACTDT